MSNVYLKNKTSSAITVAGYSVYYIDKTDAEIVEVEGANQQPLPSVGDTITFGNYPQATNDPEPIEWMVLEVDNMNGKALLIAKKALDCQPYNTNSAYVTWKTCSLRTWLNSTFLNAAFDSAEQDMIILSHVETPNNGSSSGGDPTNDKLFNLSIQEAANSAYFATASARRALGTQYAINAGAASSGGYYVAWWTRSPGDTSLNTATRVANGASAQLYNTNVDTTTIGVRPAMWLSFVSVIKYNAFKFYFSGVPYWYVIDGIQANWTDDLASIGYSEVVQLPTVSVNGDFGTNNWLFRNSDASVGSISAGGTQVLWIANDQYQVSYDSTKSYAVLTWYYGTGGSDVGANGALSIVSSSDYIAAKNDTSSTVNLYALRCAVCSSADATVVHVYDKSTGVAYNAFKYASEGTDYYYILDGVQSDWTDDLASIGYSEVVQYGRS